MAQLRVRSFFRILFPVMAALILQFSFGPAMGHAEAKQVPAVAPIDAIFNGFTWGG
ncbi:MAG: hypothetical protein KF753_23215 [Caldilineaceae bacterium]|nr:hypothetical protein [Caldilineaceae bacterium]